MKLERAPYQGLRGGFRIRPNGLLKLGHGRYQQFLDGTFCVSRNAALLPLLNDREALRNRLEQLRVPLPRHDPEASSCSLTKKAVRAAERIGYPVTVKPGTRNRDDGVSNGLRSAEDVRAAVDLRVAMPTGYSWRLRWMATVTGFWLPITRCSR